MPFFGPSCFDSIEVCTHAAGLLALYCELLWVYLVGLALVVLRASLFGVEFHQLVLASVGSPGVFHIDVIHLVLQWVASKVVVSPLVHSFGLPSTSCG